MMGKVMRKCCMAAVVLAVGLALTLGYFLSPRSEHHSGHGEIKTYFSYSEADVHSLEKMSSSSSLSERELRSWDEKMFEVVKKHKLGDAYAGRIYAYLYTAQHDAMILSKQAHGEFMGSIGPVSAQVLCQLFPDSCSELKAHAAGDAYSMELARLVGAKTAARQLEDAKPEHNKMMPQKIGPQHWLGIEPFFAREVPSWLPWRMKSGNQFVAPPPPDLGSKFWDEQLAITLDARKDATESQKMAVVFWAGGPGTVTPPGQWLLSANDYMWRQKAELGVALEARMVLAQGIVDSCIAVFNSKYTYWAPRPFMRSPSLVTIMPTPNHPSYPAGHSTISGAAQTIMSHYFPDNHTTWDKMSTEAGDSRIWGGIHFVTDNQEGVKLGRKVGIWAIGEAE